MTEGEPRLRVAPKTPKAPSPDKAPKAPKVALPDSGRAASESGPESPGPASRLPWLLGAALVASLAVLAWTLMSGRALQAEAEALRGAVAERDATIAAQDARLAAQEQRQAEVRRRVQELLELIERPLDPPR